MDEEKRELTEKINIFAKENNLPAEVTSTSAKDELVSTMFDQAVVHEVANNEELKAKVLDTAKKFTETKMQTIATNVDTEHKEAVFNNKQDACESYGFNEKKTPVWAVNLMNVGYSIMLAIWLFIGSFTFMPVIFVAKKISVGIKKSWIAIVFALIIYLGVTIAPILLAVLK